jgi:ABC-type transport system substrate-binding protein
VTAESFARAIERALHPKMQSPGATFLSDVVGADKVLAGKATRPAGVKVKGNTLAITLTRVAPDFLSRLAMPFFCSVPSNLPIEPKGVNTPPGAGPYYGATKEPGRLMVLKRNPFYKGGRKQNWDEIRITANVNENASYLQVRKGEADLDLIGLPASAHSALTKEFGINKSRYFVYPSAVTGYYALNTSRGIFKDPNVRKAVNFAIDRPALIRLRGANAGTANDQILPPGIPGYRDAKIYPLDRPNVERAKKLLGGKTGTVVLYTLNDTTAQNDAQILQANLKAIGLELEIKQFTFATMLDKAGTRGEPFDMEAIAWFADYPDPYDFVNILLYGETITKNHNVNTSYFDDPAYNRKMEAAAKLSGDERFRTYAKLDADIMRNAAPLAVVYNQNVREFISDKVGCPTWTFAWGGLNLVLLCPKK